MADTQHQKPRRAWRVIFAISLALNVAVVGLIAGVGLRDKVGGQAPRGFDMALGPIGQALRPEDRRAIGERMRQNPKLRGNNRAEIAAQVDAFVAALLAQPFSEDALIAVITDANGRVSRIQEEARTALVARITQMSEQERMDLAQRVSELRRRPRR